ncbi:hypothetical protein NDU88_008062 [Pleurodeles waltl]|uniref:Uncharacterized protein n=1 Tax=Pleurodeles waltl TaxID=8319 RepID=A0AAV7RU44_PLEWA|nr:hypothetical protein NDU88_008062 [Pleurodeles waltl]
MSTRVKTKAALIRIGASPCGGNGLTCVAQRRPCAHPVLGVWAIPDSGRPLGALWRHAHGVSEDPGPPPGRADAGTAVTEPLQDLAVNTHGLGGPYDPRFSSHHPTR